MLLVHVHVRTSKRDEISCIFFFLLFYFPLRRRELETMIRSFRFDEAG